MGIFNFLQLGTKTQKILSEYLSDLALATIGEGWKVKSEFYERIFYSNEIIDFLCSLEKRSNEVDSLFIAPLQSIFPKQTDKYRAILEHFYLFKEANLHSIFCTLVHDIKLQNLILRNIRYKIAIDFSITETKKWRQSIEEILDFLGLEIEKMKDNLMDYENDIAFAFFMSAYKLNSDVLTHENCMLYREKVFSKALITIVSYHFNLIQSGWLHREVVLNR